jgi:hypothetical protein
MPTSLIESEGWNTLARTMPLPRKGPQAGALERARTAPRTFGIVLAMIALSTASAQINPGITNLSSSLAAGIYRATGPIASTNQFFRLRPN